MMTVSEVTDMGKIVLRLDRVMADRKMSLNELSEKVGVSNVNLSKMKTGKISAIRFSTLEAISLIWPAVSFFSSVTSLLALSIAAIIFPTSKATSLPLLLIIFINSPLH